MKKDINVISQADGDIFRGVIYPPTTSPFCKLLELQKENDDKIITLVTKRGKNFITKLSTILVDSLDQEVKFDISRKKYYFFGRFIPIKKKIYFDNFADVFTC